MKPAESTQIEFIKGCLRKGEQRKTILAKFIKKWQTVAIRTFDTRLKVATKSVHAEQQRIIGQAEKGISDETEVLKSKIMQSLERQVILSQIARGEIPLEKPIVCDKEIIMIQVIPDWMDRKNAIAELNKMDGSYEPEKHSIEVDALVITRNIIGK